MPETGTTALVITLPAAEVLLDAARRVNPAVVRPIPAHVSVLYPFVPLTRDVEQVLEDIAAATPVTPVDLTEIVTAQGFVGIAASALQPVVDAVCERWPDVLPYGGRFGARPAAHLTVAMGPDASRVITAVRKELPVGDRADALRVVVLTEGRWQLGFTAAFGS
jgi:hypothetical protein